MKVNRILYLEILRILATIAVLIDHISLVAVGVFGATDTEKWLLNSLVHVTHFAVPVFVMITGSLLLQPDKIIDYKKVLTKYVWRMVVVLTICGTTFAWIEIIFESKHFALQQIFQALLNMLEGKSWNHMWYLYMLIGLYLTVPIIKAVVNYLDTKSLDFILIILLLFTSLLPCVEHYIGFKLGVKFPINSVYVFYLLMGYRMTTMKLASWKPFLGAMLLIVIAYYWMGYLIYMNGYDTLSWMNIYNSPLMVVYSVITFVVIKGLICPLKKQNISKLGGAFSQDSFGIYIFHMLWVNIIYKVVKFNPIDAGLWTLIIVLLVVILLSWGTTFVYRKIPYIGKYT